MGAKAMMLSDAIQAAVEAERKVIILKRTVIILSGLCAFLLGLWTKEHL